MRIIVSSDSGIGDVPSGAERGVNFGYDGRASGVRANMGAESSAGVFSSAVRGSSDSTGESTVILLCAMLST